MGTPATTKSNKAATLSPEELELQELQTISNEKIEEMQELITNLVEYVKLDEVIQMGEGRLVVKVLGLEDLPSSKSKREDKKQTNVKMRALLPNKETGAEEVRTVYASPVMLVKFVEKFYETHDANDAFTLVITLKGKRTSEAGDYLDLGFYTPKF